MDEITILARQARFAMLAALVAVGGCGIVSDDPVADDPAGLEYGAPELGNTTSAIRSLHDNNGRHLGHHRDAASLGDEPDAGDASSDPIDDAATADTASIEDAVSDAPAEDTSPSQDAISDAVAEDTSPPDVSTPDVSDAGATADTSTPDVSDAGVTADTSTPDASDAGATADTSTPDASDAGATADTSTPDVSDAGATADASPDVSDAGATADTSPPDVSDADAGGSGSPLPELPLLQAGDLERLGAFRFPAGNYGDPNVYDSFAYGGTGLAYYAADDSLFLVGHDWNQWVAEVSVPEAIDSSSFGDLPVVEVLQNPREITEGHMADLGQGGATLSDPKIGGLLIDGDRLIGTSYIYYDAAVQADRSHFVSSLNLAAQGDFEGMIRVGEQNPGITAGYMTHVPQVWRDALGGSALTGNSCLAIISRSSQGPAASVFDPADLQVGTNASATWVVGYPIDHPTLGEWGNVAYANPAYNMATSITGIAFPEGTNTVLFIGRTGLGVPCYGYGTSNQSQAGTTDSNGVMYCYDPVQGAKGTHAYPYVAYVWAYDAADFAAVADGLMEPWEVFPYDMWELELPVATDANQVQGAAYDPVGNRLFVSHMSSGPGGLPAVTVFGLP